MFKQALPYLVTTIGFVGVVIGSIAAIAYIRRIGLTGFTLYPPHYWQEESLNGHTPHTCVATCKFSFSYNHYFKYTFCLLIMNIFIIYSSFATCSISRHAKLELFINHYALLVFMTNESLVFVQCKFLLPRFLLMLLFSQ